MCAVLFVLDILLNYKIEYIQSIRPELSLTNQIWQKKKMKTLQDAELPQFTIKGFETNERKIKLATGTYQVHHASPNITFQKRRKGKKYN